MELPIGQLSGLESLILALSIFSIVLLVHKCIVKKEVGIIGSILARVYLGGTMVYELLNGYTIPSLVRLSIVLLLTADILAAVAKRVTTYQLVKAYEDKIKDLKHKFAAIVDNSVMPFFTVDSNCIIEDANQALAELLGITKEELLGQDLTILLKVDKEYFLDNLTNCGQVTCSVAFRNAVIFGKETQNGHKTITGSIYLRG